MSSQNIIQRDELALAHGLERLRMSNSVLGLHIEDAAFDNKDIEAYLKRSIGENIALDEEIENKLKAAVYLSIRRSKWKPRAVAKHMAEVSAHALRDARLAYLYDTDMIAAGQYKTECEKNLVTNTVNAFKRLKARKNRASVKALLATGLALTVGGPYAFMAGAILFATELLSLIHI